MPSWTGRGWRASPADCSPHRSGWRRCPTPRARWRGRTPPTEWPRSCWRSWRTAGSEGRPKGCALTFCRQATDSQHTPRNIVPRAMPDDALNAPFAGRALHFIGIGGAGMSGLALVARELGAHVTGSDQAESSYVERLRTAGIEVAIGHDAANLPPGAEVVVSTAIPDDNPELAAARAAGARVLHRGDLLGELSRMKKTIAVAGTHGKTTTASMAALALIETGREPAFLIGGELQAGGTNAAWGAGDWAVIEADESDRSFLKLGRDVAVVTNVELDHHSTYPRLSELEEAFAEFAAPAEVRVLGPGVELDGEGEAMRFGIEEGALSAHDVRLGRGSSRFRVEGIEVQLSVPGLHNVLNALA